jgi:hypothetical protein
VRIIPRDSWPQDVTYIQMKAPDSRGYYAWADEKRERVYLPKNWQTDENIDAFVWHEYQHIFHCRNNLFKEYYAPFHTVKESILADPQRWIWYALEVEGDCDREALERTAIDLGEYPVWGVAHYAFASKALKRAKKLEKVFS